ncbi:MAG: class I SAM-dependent methyltransferase [Candidatus Latescibacteria bacterium]|nr:class I SAM-dependent methyltransferase [Candidatus Latescibacterota bacterium]
MPAPYSRLAEIYDHVMRHVDYVHWAHYVSSLFARHDVVPERVMDLACGTGSLAIEMHKRGFAVCGADGCREMVEIAEKKVLKSGHPISFYHRNLLDLADLQTYDAVLCLYDSINYMMSSEAIEQVLEEVYSIVIPGGIFVLDVCTESNSIQHFSDMTEEDAGDGFFYTRHSYFDDGVQFNKFEIHFEDTGEVVEELHRQRIYPLEKVEDILEASLFEVVGAYGGFGYGAPTELSDRVHFVLRTKAT